MALSILRFAAPFVLLSTVMMSMASGAVKAIPEKPVILASIQPLALLASAIVGERGDVKRLLPLSASPHHYALKVSDRSQLNSADIVLWVGKELETMLVAPLKSRDLAVVTVSTLPGIEWPASSSSNHHDHDHHHHEGRDPHLWLNPINNAVIVDHIVAQLSIIAPENKNYYEKNAQQLKQELILLDQRLSGMLESVENVPFIVAHPAYTHFVQRYRLQQVDYLVITPERHAGAKHLYALRQQSTVKCVFQDYGVVNKAASQLASQLGVPLASLDPLGGAGSKTLVSLIENVGKDVYGCLQQSLESS